MVCAVRFDGGAGAFAPRPHTRARTVEGLRPPQCQCQCQKSKKKPQPIKTAGVIGQVSKSIRQKNVRNRKSVTVTVDQGATIVYNDYVATGGPWQGLRRSAFAVPNTISVSIYIIYIIYAKINRYQNFECVYSNGCAAERGIPVFLISIPPPWLPGVKRSSVGELLQCQNRPGALICAPSAARL